jgi:hypothetical protein
MWAEIESKIPDGGGMRKIWAKINSFICSFGLETKKWILSKRPWHE